MTVPSAGGAVAAPAWWRRSGLDVIGGRLTLNGADLEALARDHGTPLFVYDLARPVENVRALQRALARAGVPYVVRFALKARPDRFLRADGFNVYARPDRVSVGRA